MPISKIEYPAITICSQGWISTVTERAMNYQFLTYAESKGFDVANMTAQEIDALKQALLLGKLTLPYVEFIHHKLLGVKDKLSMKLYDFRFISGSKSVSNSFDSVSRISWEDISRYGS